VSTRPSRSCSRRRRAASELVPILLLLLWGVATHSGCGALLLVGGAGTSAIAFATGELRSQEDHSMDTLDQACAVAVEALAYEEIETEREDDHIRWRARTAGGDPVDIQLIQKGPEKTELRIRVGIFGDETRSRLVLEQIHQSL